MKQLLGVLILLAVMSCGDKSTKFETIDEDKMTSEQIDSVLAQFSFAYQNPIVSDSSDQILIPISTWKSNKRTSYSKSGFYLEDFPRYWNVLFYNRKSGETRLLSEDKIRISNIHANQQDENETKNKTMRGKVFYTIAETDFNRDRQLTGKDPNYLFSSDEDGKNLKRISPINEYLQYWEVVANTNQILIRTLRDVNNDSTFTKEDEAILYMAELNNREWEISEVIDSIGRKRIESLYFDQWLKKAE